MYRRYVPFTLVTRNKCNVEAWLKFFCVVMPANWRALNFGIFGVDIVDRLHFIQSIALSSDGENGMPKVINKLFPESSLWHSRNDNFNKLKNIIGQQVGASAFGRYVLVLAGREQVGNTMVERVS
jgi:hypothetical protein